MAPKSPTGKTGTPPGKAAGLPLKATQAAEQMRKPTARLGDEASPSQRGGSPSQRGQGSKRGNRPKTNQAKGGKKDGKALPAVEEEPKAAAQKQAKVDEGGKVVKTASGQTKKIEFLTEELM
jgi:hypothetical protein